MKKSTPQEDEARSIKTEEEYQGQLELFGVSGKTTKAKAQKGPLFVDPSYVLNYKEYLQYQKDYVYDGKLSLEDYQSKYRKIYEKDAQHTILSIYDEKTIESNIKKIGKKKKWKPNEIKNRVEAAIKNKRKKPAEDYIKKFVTRAGKRGEVHGEQLYDKHYIVQFNKYLNKFDFKFKDSKPTYELTDVEKKLSELKKLEKIPDIEEYLRLTKQLGESRKEIPVETPMALLAQVEAVTKAVKEKNKKRLSKRNKEVAEKKLDKERKKLKEILTKGIEKAKKTKVTKKQKYEQVANLIKKAVFENVKASHESVFKEIGMINKKHSKELYDAYHKICSSYPPNKWVFGARFVHKRTERWKELSKMEK